MKKKKKTGKKPAKKAPLQLSSDSEDEGKKEDSEPEEGTALPPIFY